MGRVVSDKWLQLSARKVWRTRLTDALYPEIVTWNPDLHSVSSPPTFSACCKAHGKMFEHRVGHEEGEECEVCGSQAAGDAYSIQCFLSLLWKLYLSGFP